MKTSGFQTFRGGDPGAEPRGIRGLKKADFEKILQKK
jgi:hypothetical protein